MCKLLIVLLALSCLVAPSFCQDWERVVSQCSSDPLPPAYVYYIGNQDTSSGAGPEFVATMCPCITITTPFSYVYLSNNITYSGPGTCDNGIVINAASVSFSGQYLDTGYFPSVKNMGIQVLQDGAMIGGMSSEIFNMRGRAPLNILSNSNSVSSVEFDLSFTGLTTSASAINVQGNDNIIQLDRTMNVAAQVATGASNVVVSGVRMSGNRNALSAGYSTMSYVVTSTNTASSVGVLFANCSSCSFGGNVPLLLKNITADTTNGRAVGIMASNSSLTTVAGVNAYTAQIRGNAAYVVYVEKQSHNSTFTGVKVSQSTTANIYGRTSSAIIYAAQSNNTQYQINGDAQATVAINAAATSTFLTAANLTGMDVLISGASFEVGTGFSLSNVNNVVVRGGYISSYLYFAKIPAGSQNVSFAGVTSTVTQTGGSTAISGPGYPRNAQPNFCFSTTNLFGGCCSVSNTTLPVGAACAPTSSPCNRWTCSSSFMCQSASVC